MEDTEARLVFTQLLEAEPAVPDLAPYIDRARRATRLRRMTLAGAGTGLVAAAVAGALIAPSLLLDQAAQPGPRPAASVVNKSSADPKAARLTEALSNINWLPSGAKLGDAIGDPEGVRVGPIDPGNGNPPETAPPDVLARWKSPGPLEFYPAGFTYPGAPKAPADAAYQADARITESTHIAEFSITVSADKRSSCPKQESFDPPRECVVTPQGDIVWTLVRDKASVVIVDVWRADGTNVSMVAEAHPVSDSDGLNKAGGKDTGGGDGQLPFTKDQLVKLALDPGLTYYP